MGQTSLFAERSMQAPREISSSGMDVRVQSGKDEWLTPPEIIQALGPFDLDPCSPIKRPWPTAGRHFTIEDNGLSQPWDGRVWLNPPYGDETGKWMKRMAEHNDGIALIFARTETATWFDFIWPKAEAILFIRGRIQFCHVDGRRASGSGGAPSALVAYGSRNVKSLMESKIPGQIVNLR